MSSIRLIAGSCVKKSVDVVVNAANKNLSYGGGVCKSIFESAGIEELTDACNKYQTPLKDGEAVITDAYGINNAKAIIHAVGPDFSLTPKAFKELFNAYYNSLVLLKENNYHTISFPLISSSIFAGNLENPVDESIKQCCRAFKEFTSLNMDYDIHVLLCVFDKKQYEEAMVAFKNHIGGSFIYYSRPTIFRHIYDKCPQNKMIPNSFCCDNCALSEYIDNSNAKPSLGYCPVLGLRFFCGSKEHL